LIHYPALEDSTQACLEINLSDSSEFIVNEIGCWNQQSISDWDNDGVIDILDTCGDTPSGIVVDVNGCVSEGDEGDGNESDEGDGNESNIGGSTDDLGSSTGGDLPGFTGVMATITLAGAAMLAGRRNRRLKQW
jgi:hypothetical protein